MAYCIIDMQIESLKMVLIASQREIVNSAQYSHLCTVFQTDLLVFQSGTDHCQRLFTMWSNDHYFYYHRINHHIFSVVELSGYSHLNADG